MLADQDRIFTNLYGQRDWGLEGAKAYREALDDGIPIVSIDRFVADLEADSVTVANAEGAAAAVRHLVGLGHRRIAIATGPANVSTAAERLSGYLSALTESKLPRDKELIQHVVFRQEGGYEAASRLLSLPNPPTAIFAASDFIALGVLRALHERRLRIPEDCAVVTFDDMPWAAALSPPLTAVAQPTYEIGATAARLLLARIRDPERPLERVRLQTQLIVRASCGAKASDADAAAATIAPGTTGSAPSRSRRHCGRRSARSIPAAS